MARISVAQAGGQNVVAFLDMIAHSEIGAALLKESDDGYNVLVGSTASKPLLFRSYADHPNIYNKASNSTAAGRYQLLHRYWLSYKQTLGLHDFSPISQDIVAIRQIAEQKALDLIKSGKFADAVKACNNIWSSLPGSAYGQHTNDIAMLLDAYQNAGGMLA